MPLELAAEPVPLYWAEDHQVIRVLGTRVPIDCIVYLFNEEKKSAEEIAAVEYPSVGLEKVYAVIAWYLRHKAEVDAYIAEGERAAAELRREIEADPEYQARRADLLAWMKQRGQDES